ncbi:hypothetical protein GW17_00016739 [Ensete ventricosum]|nr:hypothetical protein GW17_00016739 [Ensete ventricosum]
MDPDTLSSNSIDSLRAQLCLVNQRIDDVRKEVIRSKDDIGESFTDDSPFVPEVQDKQILQYFRLPMLEAYDIDSDPMEHVVLAEEFESNFLASVQPKPTATSLLEMKKREDEPLGQYLARFAMEIRAIPDTHPSLVIQAFLIGVRPSRFFWSLVELPPQLYSRCYKRLP